MAAPYSWEPSEYWDGNDGPWSTFTLRVGNPSQSLRVLPSTAGETTWAVIDKGCAPSNVTARDCLQARGGILITNNSRTWETKGNYTLGLEANFGRNSIVANYGFDTVALGLSNRTGGPVLDKQVVAGFSKNSYYMGTFGLGQEPHNFTTLDDTHPSYLTTLFSNNIIPSKSWSYTAGARYRLKGGVFGSLTLGGYDVSRFIPNNVAFHLASDISRDLLVDLKSINSKNSTGSIASLLPNSILTFIDSTLPYIYLPAPACQLFEQTFGLTFDQTAGLYTVNDTLHQSLVVSNPNFTFTIGDSTNGGATVDIVLPYASFDLQAAFPLVSNNTRYFPIQKAANESQYTLGRAFLQEAYVITNYENSTFSVSQCKFEEGLKKNIVAIPLGNPNSTSSTPSVLPVSSEQLSLQGIAGITAGIITVLILITLILTCVLRRKQKARRLEREAAAFAPPTPPEYPDDRKTISLREIDENSLCGIHEAPDGGKAELYDEKSVTGIPDSAKLETRDRSSTKSMMKFPPQELPSPDSPYELPSPDSVHELASPDHPWMSELMASEKSVAKPTKTAKYPAAKSKFALTLSAEYRHGNKRRRSEIGISHHTSGVPSMKSTLLRAPNLDRSLPPTPISESPQASRAVSGAQGVAIEDILLFYYRSAKKGEGKAQRSSFRSEKGKGW